MATFQPPPTYAEVVLVDEAGKRPPRFNPIWLKWFVDVARALAAAAGGSGTLVHNSLTGIQGGVADEAYHLSASQLSAILAALPPSGALALPLHTVAGLPTGSKGYVAMVTDSTQTLIVGLGLAVVGGGANNVPVYHDGTIWRIG
jgi:hypothetical protein